MGKLSLFIRRLKHGSIERFMNNLNAVHNEFGTNKIRLFADMGWQAVFGGVGYLEYYIFGFAKIGRKKRRTFIRMQESVEMTNRLNQAEHYDDFNNKILFDRKYSEYLKRDFCEVKLADPITDVESGEIANKEELYAFFKKHDVFFAKQPMSFGGLGVRKFSVGEFASYDELINELASKKYYLLEEAIIQHSEMSRLCPQSVNTLRICTLLSENGKPHVMYTVLRIGNGKNPVDNICNGGMYTLLSEDGEIIYPMFCDNTLEYYSEHPDNGFVFKGFRIPYFQEALDLCRSLAERAEGIRYIGWDVAVTENGPCVVEGNPMPGYDLPQNHKFLEDGCGMKQKFALAEKDL